MAHKHENEQSDSSKDLRPNLEKDQVNSDAVRDRFLIEAQQITDRTAVKASNNPENKDLPKLFIEGMKQNARDPLAQINDAIREHDEKYGIKTSTLGGESGSGEKPFSRSGASDERFDPEKDVEGDESEGREEALTEADEPEIDENDEALQMNDGDNSDQESADGSDNGIAAKELEGSLDPEMEIIGSMDLNGKQYPIWGERNGGPNSQATPLPPRVRNIQ